MDNMKLLNDDELDNVIGGVDTSSVYVDPETGLPITGWRNDIPGWKGIWLYLNNGVIEPNSNNPADAQMNPFVEQNNGWPTPSSGGSEQGGSYSVNPDWQK